MEKYSKATNDFIDAIKSVEKKVTDEVKEEFQDRDKSIKDVVRISKLLTKPGNIPKAIVAYGLAKSASSLAEDIDVLKLKNYLIDNFGSDWITWTQETITKTLFEGERNEEIENKIQAIATCLKTDSPWLEWHIFENVGKAFNHQVPVFGIAQPLSVGECAVTMYNMDKIREGESFAQEILIYVAARAADENFVYLPEGMKIGLAQEHLDSFTYDPWLKTEVQEKWERVKAHPSILEVELSDSPVDVQLGRLVEMQQYFKENTEE